MNKIGSEAVLNSLNVIENRIHEQLSTEKLASCVFFSKHHYQRMFHEIMGESVMEYVKKRKLSLAGTALTASSATVLEIALTYGYSSNESFTRAFKAYMGITPSDYRKYGLSSIFQNELKKERNFMNDNYEKNTEEIIRGLNKLIVQLKQAAEAAEKCTLPNHEAFWKLIAEQTSQFAEKLSESIGRVTSISANPDMITSRFAIVKMIEDVAFNTNLLAFNVNLFVSRDNPKNAAIQAPICEKYAVLAQSAAANTQSIVILFNELASLIFEDMRKTVFVEIAEVVKIGKTAADGLVGYTYIKDEVTAIVNELSALSYEELNAVRLEDLLFRMDIITFTASIDAVRAPADRPFLIEKMQTFSEALSKAKDLLKETSKPNELGGVMKITSVKYLKDIAYKGNILAFYTKGEISEEKLGTFLSEQQKSAFNNIVTKIFDFIAFALNAINTSNGDEIDDNIFQNILNSVTEIQLLMQKEGDLLKDKGGAIHLLSNEFKNLACGISELTA